MGSSVGLLHAASDPLDDNDYDNNVVEEEPLVGAALRHVEALLAGWPLGGYVHSHSQSTSMRTHDAVERFGESTLTTSGGTGPQLAAIASAAAIVNSNSANMGSTGRALQQRSMSISVPAATLLDKSSRATAAPALDGLVHTMASLEPAHTVVGAFFTGAH